MLTPCLGRERVQELLDTALVGSRWVSIVGPPGSGKSLVARHAAARQPDAVWVNARGVRTLADLLTTCVDGLGASAAPGDSHEGVITRALDGTGTLLVLDDVEVHPDELGDVLQRLVEVTTDARVVLTTVTPPGSPAERVVRVGPLPVPGPRQPLAGPAVDLFVARVEAAGGHPVDLARHEDDVRRLLEASGGLPLLIEQFAVQIALVGLSRVVPTASLADAVHASYRLLDDGQQRCFRRMAQMSSPVSLDVLAEVTDVDTEEATALATALVRRGLLEVMPDGRFDMLSPVRRHGLELTAATDDGELARAGVLRWADRVAPEDMNVGAADAPWLRDLPVMRSAVLNACGDAATRDVGYALANRVFSSLYTSMRAREAVEIMEAALTSGDGPAAIGAQVARRAGIAASEVRGTYEGLWLLDRADQHAVAARDPEGQLARTASIRAEMHLDAGDFGAAEREARRAIELDGKGGYIVRQATRTLTDVHVSRGDFPEAVRCAADIMPGTDANDERWISLSARTLLARVAVEQGRTVEAASACRAVVHEADELGEARVGLLAETLLRGLDRSYDPTPVDREALPWAVRLPVLAQDARDLLADGRPRDAARLAADVTALADSSRLGRDAVEARLLLGRALLELGDAEQAASTFVAALDQAVAMPMPLRVADALDGLALICRERGHREHLSVAAAARSLRVPRHAVPWGYAADHPVESARSAPKGWVVGGCLTEQGRAAVAALFSGEPVSTGSPLDQLTPAERQVAELVADGLTSRRIAEELFLSPRTVDAHLTHIYRKLDINSRTKLAALVLDRP